MVLLFAPVVLYLVLPEVIVQFVLFFAGVFLASFDKAQLSFVAKCLPDWLVIVIHVASTTAFAISPVNYMVFVPIFMVSLSLFFVSAVFGDGVLNRIFTRRLVRSLGNISYSFYLMHSIIIVTVFVQFQALFPSAKHPVLVAPLFVLCLAVSVGVSTALFLAVERPYFVWARPRTRAASALERSMRHDSDEKGRSKSRC
jgi:peptidoglycan/LPS O-acetylase OafA/YrhL